MVELKALKDCTVAFLHNGIKQKFTLKENEIIQETDELIITKLLNTQIIKQI